MITVRKSEKKDSRAIAELIAEAIEDLACLFTGREDMGTAVKVLETFVRMEENRFSYRNCLSAVDGESVAGMILIYSLDMLETQDIPVQEHLRVLGKPDKLPVECEAGEIYIDSVAVIKEARGKGIAKLLIDAAAEEAQQRGFHRLSLLVDEKKDGVKRLYEKLGFVDGGTMFEMQGHRYYRMVREV